MITIKIGPKQDPKRAMQKLKNKLINEGLFVELKKRKYYAKPSLKKRLKREEAARQRVKDKHKAIRNALKGEEDWQWALMTEEIAGNRLVWRHIQRENQKMMLDPLGYDAIKDIDEIHHRNRRKSDDPYIKATSEKIAHHFPKIDDAERR